MAYGTSDARLCHRRKKTDIFEPVIAQSVLLKLFPTLGQTAVREFHIFNGASAHEH